MLILHKILYRLNPVSAVRQLMEHRSLWKNLLKRKLTQNYRGSALGGLWCVIQPLSLLLIYTYVFREVFKVRWGTLADASDSMFAITMFCGLAFFNILSESANASATVLADHINFVKKTVFPLELLPLTQSVGATLIGALWFLLIFAGNITLNGWQAFSWSVPIFVVILLLFCIFASGIALAVAVFGAYFRDTRFVCGMVLQVLFFITPIFYPVSAVPERFRWVLEFNPFSWFVESGRNALLYGDMPVLQTWLLLIGMTLLVWQAGWALFASAGKGVADVL